MKKNKMIVGNKNPQQRLPKDGYLYSDIRPFIKPLDLILFKGSDFVSDIIRFLSYIEVNSIVANYSHAGLIVTRDILDDERLEQGKLYIWESTISGKLGQNIYNIDGNWFLGTQIRDFDALVEAYDEPDNTTVAWCQLNNNPFDIIEKKEELKKKFKEIFEAYNGKIYDMNFVSLFGAIYKNIRWLRNIIEKIFNTSQWLFCSELCALVYKELGILPKTVNEKNVIPIDFIYNLDTDKEIPKYFVKYPINIVSDIHYDPYNRIDVNSLIKKKGKD